MYHRLAHLKDVKVKQGDKVKKGQLVATIGKTGNTTSGHLHWDIARTNQWRKYVNGWSKADVEKVYIKPVPTKNIPINNDHFGWKWLDWYGKGYHPGLDLNGPGAGNSDIGNAIYSPVDGEVVYSYRDGGYNSGWGNTIIIEEDTASKTADLDLEYAEEAFDENLGDKLNENELKRMADKYLQLQKEIDTLNKTVRNRDAKITNLERKLEEAEKAAQENWDDSKECQAVHDEEVKELEREIKKLKKNTEELTEARDRLSSLNAKNLDWKDIIDIIIKKLK